MRSSLAAVVLGVTLISNVTPQRTTGAVAACLNVSPRHAEKSALGDAFIAPKVGRFAFSGPITILEAPEGGPMSHWSISGGSRPRMPLAAASQSYTGRRSGP